MTQGTSALFWSSGCKYNGIREKGREGQARGAQRFRNNCWVSKFFTFLLKYILLLTHFTIIHVWDGGFVEGRGRYNLVWLMSPRFLGIVLITNLKSRWTMRHFYKKKWLLKLEIEVSSKILFCSYSCLKGAVLLRIKTSFISIVSHLSNMTWIGLEP